MRLPRWMSSIRFRLTVLYSTLLFLLAGGGLLVTYVAVEHSTDPQAITKRYEAELVKRKADGSEIPVGTMEVASVQEIESEVTLRTLAWRTHRVRPHHRRRIPLSLRLLPHSCINVPVCGSNTSPLAGSRSFASR